MMSIVNIQIFGDGKYCLWAIFMEIYLACGICVDALLSGNIYGVTGVMINL